MSLPAPLVHIHDQALPEADFALLWRKVRALGTERLRQGCNGIASSPARP